MDRKTRAEQIAPPQELWMLWNVDDQCWEEPLKGFGMLCFDSERDALLGAEQFNGVIKSELLPVRVI